VHIVQEFNKGVYDYIIATDESAGKGEADNIENTQNEIDSQESKELEDCMSLACFDSVTLEHFSFRYSRR
jgi:hypothetical protein